MTQRHEDTESSENLLSGRSIAAAIKVHRHLGPGLLESVYEECLCHELGLMGLQFQRQVHMPVIYKGLHMEGAYRADLVVEDSVVVEIKATEGVAPVHQSQLLTYLRVSNRHLGLLINFNVPVLRNGLRRIVNGYFVPDTPPCLSVSVSNLGRPQ